MQDKNIRNKPTVIVISSLFPSRQLPNAGIFIKERMFRVARHLPLVVVSPRPWFPFQGLVRKFVPYYRPDAPSMETMDGITVYRPKFFSLPVIFRSLDGYWMAKSVRSVLKKILDNSNDIILDAHFAYPDGACAYHLSKYFNLPYLITIRGTEVPLSKTILRKKAMLRALGQANGIIAVANSLKNHIVSLGIEKDKITTIGNGVDIEKFKLHDKSQSRLILGLNMEQKVLITVAGLVPRKGIHYVIETLPALISEFGNLKYIVVGGASAEGDWGDKLKTRVKDLELQDHVIFLGQQPHDQLAQLISCADVFVLATSNEGWANVFLESFACGVPVVTTDVGGNNEVVCSDRLGVIIPFYELENLAAVLSTCLNKDWDRDYILSYAKDNTWENRVGQILGLISEKFGTHKN